MYNYFQIYNFYDDNLEFYKEEQCLICWEFSENINEINNLQSLIIFETTCNCNSYFHNKCLYDWVKQTQSCPICHKPLTIKNQDLKHFFNNSFIQKYLDKITVAYIFTTIIYLSKVLGYFILFQILLLFCKIYIHTYYEYLKESIDKDEYMSENNVYYYNYSYL
jgi:hypothetical protein